MRLIDADALTNKCRIISYQYQNGLMSELGVLLKNIEEAPTVDAEPVKHGKWLWLDGVRCSQCNYKLVSTGLPSYCPNCRARMEE